MQQFTWLTMQQAINALQGRLANTTFWTQSELAFYLNESLRYWNALTEQWRSDFIFAPPLSGAWNNTGTLAGSPRLRSVTDTYLYTQMQYMLLEQPTGGATWGGTTQFNLQAMQFALQKRRDEMIQATGCNLVDLAPINSIPGNRRTVLPDTTLEPERVRFIPFNPPVPPNTPIPAGIPPITLTREDTQTFQYFDSGYLQNQGIPESWSVASEPPLAFDVDNAPNLAGTYDVLVLQSGPDFAPPTASLLGIPDDWSMLAMYGALADLLGREAEATDRQRAEYCLKRFTDGIKVMQKSNWLLQAAINGIPVDTPSMYEADWSTPEWQDSGTNLPAIVQAGIDLVNITPSANPFSSGYGGGGFGGGGFGGSGLSTVSVDMTLVQNAPIPASLADFVQVSRDVFDVVLSYAQRLAAFKMGGEDWNATELLENDFMSAAAQTNKRLQKLGIFEDILHFQGRREQITSPR